MANVTMIFCNTTGTLTTEWLSWSHTLEVCFYLLLLGCVWNLMFESEFLNARSTAENDSISRSAQWFHRWFNDTILHSAEYYSSKTHY